MAFHLSTANVSAAKEVAERSFGRISFRQEGERLNAWCALLTLELKYGSDEALQRTIDRACQSNNPKHVHLRVCEMLGKEAAASSDAVGALQRADDMYAKLCKKFKSKKKAWLAHIEHLLKSDRSDEALAYTSVDTPALSLRRRRSNSELLHAVLDLVVQSEHGAANAYRIHLARIAEQGRPQRLKRPVGRRRALASGGGCERTG